MIHSEGDQGAVATDEELLEVMWVAAVLCAGTAVNHGANHVTGGTSASAESLHGWTLTHCRQVVVLLKH